MRVLVNSLLLLATLLLLALNVFLTADPSVRNFEVLPDMARSVAFDSFAPNANFADGKTLREPVAGTVVRGLMPLHYTASKTDAERAGLELVSPFVNDKRAAVRGAAVYAAQCETCHGPAGKGDGPVAKRGFPAPPSLLAARALALKDGQMFHILTYGQNNMPSYAAQVERDDRWRVIAYVRQLQGGRP